MKNQNRARENGSQNKKSNSPKERIRQIIKKPSDKFLNKKQAEYFDVMDENEITICVGPAGVGKSYIAVKKAVDLLHDENNKYEKILIIRPAVEAEEKLGSLPGNLKEKLDPYVAPTFYLLDKIMGKENRLKLVEEEIIEVNALSYLRGWNIDNTILIFEESQNCTPNQMKLLLTRIGYNSKFFISGDLEQSDKFRDKTHSGLYDAMEKFKDIKGIGQYTFDQSDVVRNPLISKILNKYS